MGSDLFASTALIESDDKQHKTVCKFASVSVCVSVLDSRLCLDVWLQVCVCVPSDAVPGKVFWNEKVIYGV